MNKLLVILPCYNEEENIGALISAWLAEKNKLAQKGFELIIAPVDDACKDNTRAVIEKMTLDNSEINLLIHEVNKGLGGGVSTGLTHLYKNYSPGDYAVIMDADNTHDPKYIHSMLDKISDGLDCVIASRYCESSKTVGVPPVRNFLSFGARIYYSAVLGVKNVRDYTCGYRIYSYDIIQKAFDIYGENLVEERGFSCMMEVLFKLYRAGAKFGEIPFELRYDNKKGESKMNIFKTIHSSFVTAVKLKFKIKKRK
jgi:Glycosyltransferases involved in cell wall biogenesis